ncbi:hypothetical protein WUBG_11798 [Wuchereria bancrofti]|uniref:Uncharacterized protein n=1 Tax=Wuchereria bancrofti TaxID=6293 RepID=J9E564_WUCBA|nr:hypothetical protein WUBG_11798 [Wuchereria bancrofti]
MEKSKNKARYNHSENCKSHRRDVLTTEYFWKYLDGAVVPAYKLTGKRTPSSKENKRMTEKGRKWPSIAGLGQITTSCSGKRKCWNHVTSEEDDKNFVNF